MSKILLTKIYIPEASELCIEREELLTKLQNAGHAKSHVSLICAPAGYGKTTLAMGYLSSIRSKKAWFFIDEGDNDSSCFISYLIAALTKAGIPIGREIEFLAGDAGGDTMKMALTELINAISEYNDPITLVLDDYQFIRSRQVNEIVKFLIDHQPPNLHLMILSRADPQLQLTKLRAGGRLTEIRMSEMAFSLPEAARFFQRSAKINLGAEEVNKIFTRTEGWIAGMQLVAILFKNVPMESAGQFIERFDGTHACIIDYLVEEVLERLPEEIKDFLYNTCILERMNARVCNALTGRADSRNVLRQLDKLNLFLLSLDESREWYRYHHLFADSLKAGLPLEKERELYRKAAIWMSESGYAHEAVRYAFKSGDMHLVVKIVEDHTYEIFQNAQLETFNAWLDNIPGELIRESEILAVRKSIGLFITGRDIEAVEHLESLGEDFFRRASSHNKGLIFSLRALIASHSSRDSQLLAEKALELLEPWDPIARTSMLNTLAKALYHKGQTAEALEAYERAYETGLKMGYTFFVTLTLMNYGICLDAMGCRDQALKLYTDYEEGMKKQYGKPLPYIGIIYIAMAELFYDENLLEKAERYLDEGIKLCQSLSYVRLVFNITLANIYFARGETEASFTLLRDLMRQDRDLPGIKLRAIGIYVQQQIRLGNTEGLESYASSLERFSNLSGTRDAQEALLYLSRLNICVNKPDEAAGVLTSLETVLKENQSNKNLITVYLLLAVAYYKMDDIIKAEDYLHLAVSLAFPNHYIRLFADELLLLSELLTDKRISSMEQYREFIKEVLSLSPGFEKPVKRAEKPKGAAVLEYGEQLSEREKEILTLIAAGLSNSDISKRLYISINTTQWHISHIFGKLCVKNRTKAIIKAKELGVI